jgi:hypothetical protein
MNGQSQKNQSKLSNLTPYNGPNIMAVIGRLEYQRGGRRVGMPVCPAAYLANRK